MSFTHWQAFEALVQQRQRRGSGAIRKFVQGVYICLAPAGVQEAVPGAEGRRATRGNGAADTPARRPLSPPSAACTPPGRLQGNKHSFYLKAQTETWPRKWRSRHASTPPIIAIVSNVHNPAQPAKSRCYIAQATVPTTSCEGCAACMPARRLQPASWQHACPAQPGQCLE